MQFDNYESKDQIVFEALPDDKRQEWEKITDYLNETAPLS